MAEPTNELVYRALQQIQETLSQHTKQLEKLMRSMEDVRQTGATALGFAMHANLRHEGADERLAELERQFGTLEDLKRRVDVLEHAR